jgi:protein FAM50
LDEQPPRKKKKKAFGGLLSFNDEEDANRTSQPTESIAEGNTTTAGDSTALPAKKASIPRRLTPNPNAAVPAPKVFTKATLQAEAAARDQLRREFLELQEKVKNTEIVVPFVFYDGTSIPGGAVRVKKGDHVWLFLDRCRKVGAELGVAGGANSTSKSKNDSRKEWARVGVDDLMCVRGDVIIPHVCPSRSSPP